MPEAKQTQEQETSGRPDVGLSGRKIVYDKDGKPCRTCNSLMDFQFATSGGKVSALGVGKVAHQTKKEEPFEKVEPPDVEQLGRSSWTLLHSIAATYPESPSSKEQADLKQFVKLFGNFYPCWFCGEDFQKYIQKNEPLVESQDKFGKWLCNAHNEVNRKLNKPVFDCDLWKKRWKDGWDETK